MNIEKIKEHYEHAKEKHPYFCDGLLPTDTDSGWSKGEVLQKIVLELRLARDRIEVGGKIGNRLWNEILNCEVWELAEAIYHKNTTLPSKKLTTLSPYSCAWWMYWKDDSLLAIRRRKVARNERMAD